MNEAARPDSGQEGACAPQVQAEAGQRVSSPQQKEEAGAADRGEPQGNPDGGRLSNPLPDPVQGRREAPEFSISDTGDGRWPPLADTVNLDDFDDIRDAREDDFDIRISDADDFDI